MPEKSPHTKFLLVPDSNTRSRAVVKAGETLLPGEVILRVSALVTSLLPKWKGKRCDWCCRKSQVKACSRCKEVSYCSSECQTRAWKAHHRRTCALLSNGFHLSTTFMSDNAEQQANSDLLMNLWGAVALSSDEGADPWTVDQSEMDLQRLKSDTSHCFKSLMAHPSSRTLPAVPPSLRASHANFLRGAWSRFDCNNFVLHNISSLEPESGAYALGVFPLASRCFNHSCVPNAWAAFQLWDRQAWLEVRAVEAIPAGTEITIPYLDSALAFRDRQLRLSQVYGFECSCQRCKLEKTLDSPTSPSENSALLEAAVVNLVFGPSTESWQVRSRGIDGFALLPSSVRHETFMKDLSERFESQAHDGPYEEAWITGRALLALCLLVYPENYPLTGRYYVVELAKACWNAYVLVPESIWLSRITSVLAYASKILNIVGAEEEDKVAAGLLTCETLESLVTAEQA